MLDTASSSSDTATSDATQEPWKLVVHQYPDTDAWACLWAGMRFVVPKSAECSMHFVRAGESLPEDECAGFKVLHMDTGLGTIDQHGKQLKRASSFELLVDHHDLKNDPGLQPILELTKATDNVEAVSPTSIHYYFKGLPILLKDPTTREVDWQGACDRVFEVLDVIYGQAAQRAQSRKEFWEKGKLHRLNNNIRVGVVLWHAGLREAAFEASADVVIWTQGRGKNRFDVGIQVSRRSTVTLDGVAGALRQAEAQRRGTVVAKDVDICQIGNDPAGSKWFFHDSRKLVVCGTRAHPLVRGEFTELKAFEIVELVLTALGTTTR